jgi:hypothetical protein
VEKQGMKVLNIFLITVVFGQADTFEVKFRFVRLDLPRFLAKDLFKKSRFALRLPSNRIFRKNA